MLQLNGGMLEPRSSGAATMAQKVGSMVWRCCDAEGCYNCGRKKLEQWFGGVRSMVQRSCNRSLAELHGDHPSARCCSRGLRELESWSVGAARLCPTGWMLEPAPGFAGTVKML